MFNLIPWKRKSVTAREPVPTEGHPLAELRDAFDALFDRFLSRWTEPFAGPLGLGRFWGLDVEDSDQEVVVRAEVPGFEPEDLNVQVSGNVLTIKTEKKEERKGHPGNGRYLERRYRAFQRTVTLPPGTDPDRIEARYRNGVLEVHVPKSEQAGGKRIPIKA